MNDEKLWPVICPKCGHSEWKTLIIHREYKCKNCGFIRNKWIRKLGTSKKQQRISTPKRL